MEITVPTFKSRRNRLYSDLLKKQLGFVGGAEQGIDPYSMAQGFRKDAMQSLEGDTTGFDLAELTGDEGARASYELGQKNKVTEQYNDILTFYNSPEGRMQIARAKAGLYGPETLSALQLLPTGFAPQSGGGGLFGDVLGVAATAGGMGWSPFG